MNEKIGPSGGNPRSDERGSVEWRGRGRVQGRDWTRTGDTGRKREIQTGRTERSKVERMAEPEWKYGKASEPGDDSGAQCYKSDGRLSGGSRNNAECSAGPVQKACSTNTAARLAAKAELKGSLNPRRWSRPRRINVPSGLGPYARRFATRQGLCGLRTVRGIYSDASSALLGMRNNEASGCIRRLIGPPILWFSDTSLNDSAARVLVLVSAPDYGSSSGDVSENDIPSLRLVRAITEIGLHYFTRHKTETAAESVCLSTGARENGPSTMPSPSSRSAVGQHRRRPPHISTKAAVVLEQHSITPRFVDAGERLSFPEPCYLQ
ncbi:hypothetical protein MRB53_041132 [Persea americana]|nr:hypothetical protein MRB53_041132 [Persea americana]